MADVDQRRRYRGYVGSGDRAEGLRYVLDFARGGNDVEARSALCSLIEDDLCGDSIRLFHELYPGIVLLEDGGDHYKFHNLEVNIPGKGKDVYSAKLLKKHLGAEEEGDDGNCLSQRKWIEKVNRGEFGEYSLGSAPLHTFAATGLYRVRDGNHPVVSQRTLVSEVHKFLRKGYGSRCFATDSHVEYAPGEKNLDTVEHGWRSNDPVIVKGRLKGCSGPVPGGSDTNNAISVLLGESDGSLLYHVLRWISGRTPYICLAGGEGFLTGGDWKPERGVLLGHGGGLEFVIDANDVDVYGSHVDSWALGWSIQKQNFSE